MFGGLSGAYLRLYQNDPTLASNMMVSDFTEADFPGYAGPTLLAAGLATTADPAVATFTPVVNTFSSGTPTNTIYGYYVTDGGGNLLWAERDPSAPITMASPGDTYTVTPTYSRGNI
jgi:hypothetical protein